MTGSRLAKSLALLSIMACLSACGGPAGRERDTRSMSNRDTCIAACNRDSDLCTDEPSNSRERLPGLGSTFTTGRQCGLNLGACLDRCKAL